MSPFIFTLIHLILLAIALGLAIPILALMVQCLAALFPNRTQSPDTNLPRPAAAVLIPAHNEAAGIGTVIDALLPQLTENDQIVVVADNCTDATASVVREKGVTVIERHNLEQRGKGYALDYGIQYLRQHPPEVIFVLDADCIVEPGTLGQIVQRAAATGQPVQARNLLEPPSQPQARDAISAFAFRVKNYVRPLGLTQLGLPCLLTGTGMAIPFPLLANSSLASGNLVEDMNLAVNLAIAGHTALYEANSRVTGWLPQQDNAAKSQRTRWEQGHLQTLLTQTPRLIKAAILQKRLDLLAIALDISIPPLALLVLLWVLGAGLALLAVALGIYLPAILFAVEGVVLLGTILGVWVKFGRSDLPVQTLIAVPFYILWKIPVYIGFLFRPQKTWVRTERDPLNPG